MWLRLRRAVFFRGYFAVLSLIQGRFQIVREFVDVFFSRIPRTHQSSSPVRAHIVIKSPASFMELVHRLVRYPGKDGIPFSRVKPLGLGETSNQILEAFRHRVGVPRSIKPETVLEVTKPRRRQEPHFRSKLASLF